MHSTPVRAAPPVQPAAARREPMPPMPLPPPKRPRGRPRKVPVQSSASQSTPQLEYDRSTPSASPSVQERSDSRPAPSSASPSNSTLPPAGDVFDDPPASRASPTPSDTAAPKRKRGRPRKYPYDANKEAARAAAKAAASITPWRRIAMVERPPVYPETHVMIPVRRAPTRSLWDSPQKTQAAPRPSWMYYERPVRQDLVGKRPDQRAPEPLPPAPVGRRGRTRVDYPELAHWQLACRARGERLDPRALWAICVERWRQANGVRLSEEPAPSEDRASDTLGDVPSSPAPLGIETSAVPVRMPEETLRAADAHATQDAAASSQAAA